MVLLILAIYYLDLFMELVIMIFFILKNCEYVKF